MANVMFKRGTHADLIKNVQNNAIDGTFYLTTDTNRLYVGQQVKNSNTTTTKLVELNQSITIVDAIDKLPTSMNNVAVGQFYYVSSGGDNTHRGNILVVCAGAEGDQPRWVQINPDTNDNDHLSSVSVDQLATKTNDGAIPYKLTFYMADKTGEVKSNTSVTIDVSAKDIISQIDTEVTSKVVEDATNGDVATITTQIKNSTLTNNNLSAGSSFSLKAGKNVALKKNANDQIEISTSIGTDSVKLAIDVAGTKSTQPTINTQVNGVNSGDTLTIKGDNGIKVVAAPGSGSESNKKTITIQHSNTASAQASAAVVLKNGDPFTAIVESNYDDYGHITSQKTQNITLPKIKAKEITVDGSDKSKLKFSITDQTGSVADNDIATSDSILYYYITVDGKKKQKILNQGDLGSFYSAAEIDRQMRTLDALTYRGLVKSSDDKPTSKVRIGDTYKVAADNSGIKINGVNAKLGDLIIATSKDGKEEEDGYIDSNKLEWTLVAGGTDDDTTYKTKVTSGGSNVANVGIIASTSVGQEWNQYTTFSGDGVITVTATNGEDTNGKVALAHTKQSDVVGTYGGDTATLSAKGQITVPKITVNETGHITSVSNSVFTLPDENKLEADAANKQVKLQNSKGTDLGSITFAKGDLTDAAVTGSGVNETVTINHTVPTDMADNTTLDKTPDLSSDDVAKRQIVAISGITKDRYGHVTQVDTTTYSLDWMASKLESKVSTATNSVTITADLKDHGGRSKGNSTFTVKSPNDTLSITNTATTDNIDINVDIVWGSF